MTARVAQMLAYYCHCVNLSVNVRLVRLLVLCCLFCCKSGKIYYSMKSLSSSSDKVEASFEIDYSDAICPMRSDRHSYRGGGGGVSPLFLCPLVNSLVLVGRLMFI